MQWIRRDDIVLAYPGGAVYGATKWAVRDLMEVLEHQSMKALISFIGIPVDFRHSMIFKASISDSLNILVQLDVLSTKGIRPSLS